MDKVYTQNLNPEIDDAFKTAGIIIRAKIERLCNNGEYIAAKELEDALIKINNTDYNL